MMLLNFPMVSLCVEVEPERESYFPDSLKQPPELLQVSKTSSCDGEIGTGPKSPPPFILSVGINCCDVPGILLCKM